MASTTKKQTEQPESNEEEQDPAEGTAEDTTSEQEEAQTPPDQPGTALERRPSVAIEEAQTMNAVAAWGRLMAQSGFFKDARTAAQAAVKILVGRELGFGVTESMMGVHLIEGRPALGAGLMANAVKRSGVYDYRIREHDNDHCEIAFFQKLGGRWDELGRSVFSIDDARRAGLVKAQSNWEKWPKNMVFARALSNGVRFYCPDVFGQTVYTPEEINPDLELSADGEIIDISSIAVEPNAPEREPRQQQQRAQEPTDPPRDRSAGRSTVQTGQRRQTQQGGTRRQPPAKFAPDDWSKVVDVQTLMTWAFQAYGKQSADVFDVLNVGGTSDIAAANTSPEDYRESVLELLHEWDPVRYNAAMEAALGPAEGDEALVVDDAAAAAYDAESGGPDESNEDE